MTISRQSVLKGRDRTIDVATDGSPWDGDDLVQPRTPGVGHYGDDVWVFPSDRGSGRPTKIVFSHSGMFPSDEWCTIARELAMAMLGRRPGRDQLARDRTKPVTVAQAVRRVGTIGRWATNTGHGLPNEWTADTVASFIEAYNGSRLPNRVKEANPKSSAEKRQTLGAYLNIIATLHEYRQQLTHGMTARPWHGWPSIGAHHLSGSAADVGEGTDIIEPAIWWAAVRNALRILNEWAPDVIVAWNAYHAANASRTLPWGAEARHRIKQWALEPTSLLPVNAKGGASAETVAAWCGVDLGGGLRGPLPYRSLEQTMRREGRTTRCWWPRPARPGDDPSPTWLGYMDTETLFSLVAAVRNAALVVLAALSAMRDSELQELRVGCVEFHDGSWALKSFIQKKQLQPQPAVWWVTPVAVHAVGILEQVVRPIDVFTITADGERVLTDHLVCTLQRHAFGRAGLSSGNSVFKRFAQWVDEHAEELGLEPIGTMISPHQFRKTFAVIAAWQPDGHVAVELQLKDTADVAAGYYANTDRKWFEAYEFAKAEARAARLHAYIDDGEAPDLGGPAGTTFAARALAAHTAGAHPALDDDAGRDAQQQAATQLAVSHACGDGWDCAGDQRVARCLAVSAARGDGTCSSAPQLSSGLCFELGSGSAQACRNVILDPAAHLAFWDVEAAHLAARAEHEMRPFLRERLELELAGARSIVDELEAACARQPTRLLRRFEHERLRLLERLTDERHAPGAAAIYRPVIDAQEQRIAWLITLAETT